MTDKLQIIKGEIALGKVMTLFGFSCIVAAAMPVLMLGALYNANKRER
jgi:hypothetical protein